MLGEIVPLQNNFLHNPPLVWKALISVNVEDGILVQDGGRQQQGPQQVLKTTTPNYATNDHVHWCRGGFRAPWKPKKYTQPDKTNLTKTTAALGDAKPACANR